MVKNLVSLSLLASLVLIGTGCGGGGGSNTTPDNNRTENNNTVQKDTTPPVITNQTNYSVEENTERTVTLTANEPVTYSMIEKPNFTLTDATLVFTAPDYNTTAGANNDYNTTVTATDEAGNEANTTFVFTVTKAPVKQQRL